MPYYLQPVFILLPVFVHNTVQLDTRIYYFARASGSGRSIAIGLSVCLPHHVHNVLNVLKVLNVHLAPDQSRASISGRDLISPGVANGTAVALPSSGCLCRRYVKIKCSLLTMENELK